MLLQQGSQIGDIFASSSATLGGFARQTTAWLSTFLTLGRVAFGGITVAIGGATLALENFLTEQDKVKIALSGAGRASGASVSGINSVAGTGASAFGLSVAGARELATALAATGKIANDNLLPIVKIGRDFAITFGVTDAEAAKQLAAAFADPLRGAEQLNERLGFLDASTQRHINSLMAQNRIYDAQRLLLDGVQGSLAKTAEVTSVWSQAWLGLKNTASNAFDVVGEKLANVLHLNDSLQQQKARLQEAISGYESGLGRIFGSSADLENLKRQLADINALIEKQARASQDAASAQASLRVQQTILGQLPEIGARQALADAAGVGGAAAEDPLLIKKLGLTQAQVDRAKAILQQLKNDFKTTFEEIRANSQISYDAVTAFSPSAKAAIAQRQATEQYRAAGGLDPSEKARISQDAYNLSLHQTITALREAARVRALTANQSVQSAQLEIDLLGKTVGEQAELKANLQARQQLEQQASQYRTAFDDAEYERLKKINAELGKQTQLAAVAAVNDNIRFGSRTALLSPEDVSIAQQLRGLYPDVASGLNSVEANALRANAALSQASSTISGNLTTGIADAIDGTKTFGAAMADTGKLVVRALEEMIIKLYIIGPLMRSLQSGFNMFGFGSFGGMPGIGETSAVAGASEGMMGGIPFPMLPAARGAAFSGGNVIPFARGGIVTRPVLFPMANGSGLMGEAGPEAVMPLRRGSDGRLGVSMVGGSGDGGSASGRGGDIIFSGGIQISVPEGTSPTDAATIARTVKDSMAQVIDERIMYHTRSRGLLNRVA